MAHELHQERLQVEKLTERAILVACHLPDAHFDVRDPLGELRDLTHTAGAEVVSELIQKRRKPDNGTYLGKGKIEELKVLKDELDATLIIFDNDLVPSQIRNIEKVVDCKIIDRSELILDIFAGRAATTAAKIQVELAQLEYTYPRLRAMWTHFGQLGGGIGTRGPGETQIETDRRLVQRRKTVLRRRIEEIQQRRVREVAQRASENFTVCFVGYTNAGKSTLFNALTEPSGGGGAYADDRLFATLTTRTRRWPLNEVGDSEGGTGGGAGNGDAAMLSDTVGFVRDLPHHLIASFRATLEEAIHADVLLLVLDVSDPQSQFHYEVVTETLDSLQADYERMVERLDAGEIVRKVDFPGLDEGDVDEEEDVAAPLQEIADVEGKMGTDDLEDEGDGFEQLGIPVGRKSNVHHPKRVVILNKVDLLADQSELAYWHALDGDALPVSAVSGAGLADLRERVADLFHGGIAEYEAVMPFSAAKALSYAEHRGEVLSRDYDATNVTLRIRLGKLHVNHLRTMGVKLRRMEAEGGK